MDSTLTQPETSRTEPRDTGRINRWFRWVLRIAITLHALDTFTQAVLAGRFLSGDYGMLQAHLANANFGVSTISAAQIIAAVLYWRPGGGRGWPALASLALTGTEAIQIALGVNRVIGIHVPLGVLVILASTAFAVWAWRPTFGLRRGRRSAA